MITGADGLPLNTTKLESRIFYKYRSRIRNFTKVIGVPTYQFHRE